MQDICKNNNLFLLNGRSYLDKELGQYTFRDKSVLDYVIPTADVFEQHFEVIDTDPLFSDGHNALSWQTKISPQINPYTDAHEVNTRPPWIAGLESIFIDNIDQDQLQILIDQFNTYPQSQRTIRGYYNGNPGIISQVSKVYLFHRETLPIIMSNTITKINHGLGPIATRLDRNITN